MKSKVVTAIMLVGLLATGMPLTAMARDGAGNRPGWAYQHPGWWQYYRNHSRPNYGRHWRDIDDWYGRGNRDRDGDHDAWRDRHGWNERGTPAYWGDRDHDGWSDRHGGWFGGGDHDGWDNDDD